MKKLFVSLAVVATFMFSAANANAANAANFEPTTTTEIAAVPAPAGVDIHVIIFDDGTVIIIIIVY